VVATRPRAVENSDQLLRDGVDLKRAAAAVRRELARGVENAGVDLHA